METLKRIPWSPITILLLVALSHVNSLPGSFHYDDNHSIIDNIHLSSADIWKRLWYDYSVFSVEKDKAMYRPLVVFSYAVTNLLTGIDSFSFILTNLFIHACVSLVILMIIRHLYSHSSLAWLSSAIFAIHPINSQVNNYISSRSESMAVLGILVSLLCFNKSKLFFGIIAYVGGLASKSQALLALPFYLLFLGRDFLKKQRIVVIFIIFFSVVYVSILTSSGFLLSSVSQEVREYHIQLFTQIKALVYYLLLFITPFNLSIEHTFVESLSFSDIPTFCASIFLISLIFFLLKYRSIYVVGGIIFFFSMIITFLVPLNVLINEHRLYLGSCGLALCVSVSLVKNSHTRLFSIIYLLCLFSFSYQRNFIWQNDFNLWQDAVYKAPESFRAQSNWGLALLTKGRVDEAEASLKVALGINPRYARTWNNLGLAFTAQGKFDEAQKAFEKAIGLNPEMIGYYTNMGQMLVQQGKYGEAISTLNEAILIDSVSSEIHINLGNAHQRAGRPDYAVNHYKIALLSDNLDAEVLNNLGIAEQDLGLIENAEESFLKAVDLAPYDVRPQINLKVLRGKRMGKNTLEIYEEISKTYWNSIDVWMILATEWSRIGKYPKALFAYNRILEIDPKNEIATTNKAHLKSLIMQRSN